MKHKVRYPVHSNPPLVPILNQTHPVHTFQTYFFKIYSKIILPSTPMSSEFSSLQVFWSKLYTHVCYTTSTLNIEAARSSETLVSNHHTTRSNNPENHEFYYISNLYDY